MIHCWFPEHHKNGDSTASVSIWPERNKVKCFGCGTPPLGVINLTMSVLSTDLPGAILWLSEHFTLQYIAKAGKHLESKVREHPYQIGHEKPLDLLVISGIWSALGAQTQRIVPVLLKFGVPEGRDTFRVNLSYTGLMRYSGIKLRNSIVKALEQLREIGWLRIERSPSGEHEMKKPSYYILTPYSDELIALANDMAAQTRRDIETERKVRKEQRRARQDALDAAKKATSGKFAGNQGLPQSNAYKV